VNPTILMVGLNHTTAPIHVREQVACTRQDLAHALPQLIAPSSPLAEALILSTCNRTEVYAVTGDPLRGEAALHDFFAARREFASFAFDHCLYARREHAAVVHALTVAAGLDSMIVGEFEILGQVRAAYEFAQQQHTLGAILTTLFHAAIHTGKRARTETAIGRGAASVAYAAVELARQKIGTLQDRAVLVIGSGEMGQRVAKNLCADGVSVLRVTSRTFDHALEIASDLGGNAIPFSELEAALSQTDVVISATGAPHTILSAAMIERAMAARSARALMLIDIAMPRDIDPRAAQIPNVHLSHLDDLQGLARDNLAEREKEAAKVRTIIAEEAQAFQRWFAARRAAPVIAELRARAETIRALELNKAMCQLGHLHLSARDRNVIAALAAGIVSKLLAAPTAHLKERVQSGDGQVYLAALRELFELSESEPQG